jgi:hypothetical protein
LHNTCVIITKTKSFRVIYTFNSLFIRWLRKQFTNRIYDVILHFDSLCLAHPGNDESYIWHWKFTSSFLMYLNQTIRELLHSTMKWKLLFVYDRFLMRQTNFATLFYFVQWKQYSSFLIVSLLINIIVIYFVIAFYDNTLHLF